jgi:hypothetical protein
VTSRFRSPLVFAAMFCFGTFAALTAAQPQSAPPNSAQQTQKPSDMPGMDMSGCGKPV